MQEIKKRAHSELLKRLNLKKLALSGASEEELGERAKETIKEIQMLCKIKPNPEINPVPVGH